jgi:ankyrin repeat protein
LGAGADVDKTGEDRRTPLYVASSEGNGNVVEMLLKAGADMNKANEYGWTPLFVAYYFRHNDVIKILLRDSHTEVNDDIMTKLRAIGDEEIITMAIEKHKLHLKEDLNLRF